LVGRNEHEIGQTIDQEVRAALRDVANWPEKMTNPSWSAEIDPDLMPPPEDAGSGNGDGDTDASAKRERVNAKRRQKYAQSKEV
jgi:hypothetical protein